MTTVPSSPADPPKPPWARLVEFAVAVPVEVSGRIVDAMPAVVDKVPAAAGRIRREIVLARFLGKLVVDQGVRELRSRLAPAVDAADPAASYVPPVVAAASSPATPVGPVPDVDTLALADYDHLSSAQIVAKLADLEPSERRTIEKYELAGRQRRTILGKLALLEAADDSDSGS